MYFCEYTHSSYTFHARLAACWAQYTAQERMVKVAKENNVELTFFHGKGGTVGRGGNPALYRAVLSHPPGTINGRFRVTEQVNHLVVHQYLVVVSI